MKLRLPSQQNENDCGPLALVYAKKLLLDVAILVFNSWIYIVMLHNDSYFAV